MTKFRSVQGALAYHMNLHTARAVKALRHGYQTAPGLVYIIQNTVTGHLYVGSTMTPAYRFHSHFVARSTNSALQAAITQYGLSKFKVYIMQTVTFPTDVSNFASRVGYLRAIEQSYMDKFPLEQLYNTVKAKA